MGNSNNTLSFKKINQDLQCYFENDYHFSKGHILGSMCTMPHPLAIKAYQQFMDTNLGDPDLFPGTKKMEQKLPADKFIRIHRSYLISVKKITAFNNEGIEIGPILLPIGKNYKDSVLSFLEKHI